MLIRFNVSNFLSFDELQEFSMIGGKVRSKTEHVEDDRNIKLLKFAALYGANAAGKSNLISAIDFARATIVEGLPDGHSNKYHKIRTSNKEKPIPPVAPVTMTVFPLSEPIFLSIHLVYFIIIIQFSKVHVNCNIHKLQQLHHQQQNQRLVYQLVINT